MKYVNKGFRLKGITIGQIVDGGMVIGIDNCKEAISDIAILRNKYMDFVCMKSAGEFIYGLKEYEDCKTVQWISSSHLEKYKYKNINKRIS